MITLRYNYKSSDHWWEHNFDEGFQGEKELSKWIKALLPFITEYVIMRPPSPSVSYYLQGE